VQTSLLQVSNLVDLLRSRAERQPDRVAYVFLHDGEGEAARLTYGELDAQARAVAALLQREGRGSAVGERALLLFPPGAGFIE
jgi:acyl-CoA synthetase (AMP-forming)/AMP-acid ligase II